MSRTTTPTSNRFGACESIAHSHPDLRVWSIRMFVITVACWKNHLFLGWGLGVRVGSRMCDFWEMYAEAGAIDVQCDDRVYDVILANGQNANHDDELSSAKKISDIRASTAERTAVDGCVCIAARKFAVQAYLSGQRRQMMRCDVWLRYSREICKFST